MSKSFADKKFCTWCGNNLKDASAGHKQCASCGVSEFSNPKAGVLAVITNEKREVLCAVRAHAPGVGKYDMPGGFIDAAESAEEALVRELKEELDLDIKESDLQFIFTYHNLYTYDDITQNVLDVCFSVQIPSSAKLCATDDVASVTWVPIAEIDYDNLWSPLMSERLKQYFAA